MNLDKCIVTNLLLWYYVRCFHWPKDPSYLLFTFPPLPPFAGIYSFFPPEYHIFEMTGFLASNRTFPSLSNMHWGSLMSFYNFLSKLLLGLNYTQFLFMNSPSFWFLPSLVCYKFQCAGFCVDIHYQLLWLDRKNMIAASYGGEKPFSFVGNHQAISQSGYTICYVFLSRVNENSFKLHILVRIWYCHCFLFSPF